MVIDALSEASSGFGDLFFVNKAAFETHFKHALTQLRRWAGWRGGGGGVLVDAELLLPEAAEAEAETGFFTASVLASIDSAESDERREWW